MHIYGSFVNKKGKTVTVDIINNNGWQPVYKIGDDKSGIWFTDDPVEIESEFNDTFDVLLTKSATIRLESRIALTGLYSQGATDTVVRILEDDKCIFAGFVEPQSFSQPFNNSTDEVEINCIDVLSAMQYIRFGYIGSSEGVDYEEEKRKAVDIPFLDLIILALEMTTRSFGMLDREYYNIFYDGSRKLTQTDTASSIFEKVGISELLILGEEEDDTWTLQDILKEILCYLGLHIEQIGNDFYIFSWNTAKKSGAPKWSLLAGGGESELTSKRKITIDTSIVADDGTTLSVGESFNLISLTCDVTPIENIIKSPLDNDDLTSPYSRRQKYCTTLSATGTSEKMKERFVNALSDREAKDYFLTTEMGFKKDWYIQVMQNDNWWFRPNSLDMGAKDLYQEYCKNGTLRQELLPNAIGPYMLRSAALIAWGSAELLISEKDNSVQSRIDMSNYLVIPVGGNKGSGNNALPTAEILRGSAPVAKYKSPVSGSLLVPVEDGVTNYIVFSGSLTMTPVCSTSAKWVEAGSGVVQDLKGVSGADGERFYMRKWWKTDYPCGPVTEDFSVDPRLTPPDEGGEKYYEFKSTKVSGAARDYTSKLAVIACMLIVGDKCLVENTDGDGQIKDFEWKKYKKREQCVDDDEYFSQVFYLGIDPKVGDFVVGHEFNIQNNITYDLGLEEEGTAIPIKKSDNLSGEIEFHILGPVWQILGPGTIERSPIWAKRRGDYGEDNRVGDVYLTTHIENIYFKDFEVKVCSDKNNDSGEDSDLVYMSATDENYVNKKDDISFRITSALTADEMAETGVNPGVGISTPVNLQRKEGLLEIYNADTGETAKPEQHYVDEAWRECHAPRLQILQNVDDKAGIKRFDIIKHPALKGKEFFIQGISRNLMEGESVLNLREIGDD